MQPMKKVQIKQATAKGFIECFVGEQTFLIRIVRHEEAESKMEE